MGERGGGVPAPGASVEGDFQPSLDVSQRVGANVLASGTVNTDFAETEVDARRTNLTRFPLFFPEKRTFFIEGDDIFSFGLGLNDDVMQPAWAPDSRWIAYAKQLPNLMRAVFAYSLETGKGAQLTDGLSDGSKATR